MTKRLLSLLLCALIALSCAGALAEGDLAMSDVPGMTAAGVLPIAPDGVTLTVGLTAQSNVVDYSTNDFTLWIKDKTGITFDFFFLPSTETAQKVDLMIAANEKLPDILLEGISDKVYYGRQGVLLPMNEYFEKYAHYFNETTEKYLSEEMRELLKSQMYAWDGKIYAFPYLLNSLGNDNENIFYINKTWLDKLNLAVPTTTDELYTALKAFKEQDPNGNGQADELPLMGYNSADRRGDVVGNLLNAFLYYPYNTNARLVVNDGVVSSALTSEALREGLRYCRKLYAEGLISELSMTQAPEQLKAIIDRPVAEDTVVGMVATHALSAACGWSTEQADSKVFDYVAMEPLTGPEGVRYAAQAKSGFGSDVAITKDCKTPEIAFRWMDYMCDLEAGMTFRYGKPDYDWFFAAEGEKDKFGHQALFRNPTDHDVPWALESQNTVWRLATCRIWAEETMGFAAVKVDNKVQQYRQEIFDSGVAARLGCQPDEVFVLPVYNEEETEVVNEYGPMIWEYSNEARNLFVTGELDLDKDWDEYLAKLENIGLNEYIAASQTCYDRMQAG